MLRTDEKKGKIAHPEWYFRGFRDAILDCDLHDVTVDEYQFTWSCSKGTDGAVEERLDRAMGNTQWFCLFLYARVQNLVADKSEHSPILLNTNNEKDWIVGKTF